MEGHDGVCGCRIGERGRCRGRAERAQGPGVADGAPVYDGAVVRPDGDEELLEGVPEGEDIEGG